MSETTFEPITQITQTPVWVPDENVDTDQIFAAKFLTITVREGLGEYAFYDWRRDKNDDLIEDHYLNTTPPDQRRIMLGGRNFGCGSSREHAPWALYDYGVRAVIAPEIADIFYNNCLKNGMAAISISDAEYEALTPYTDQEMTVDLETQEIRYGSDKVLAFEMDGLARACLLSGQDQLDLLLSAKPDIDRFEAAQAAV